MKNTFISFFFMLCLIAPIGGAYVALRIQKRSVRREVKHRIMRGISKDELVLLKFTPKQSEALNWKHDKEFEYKNSMYDIVSKETHGDTIFYYVWWDKEETELNQKLFALVDQVWNKIPSKNEHQKQITHFLKSLFVQNDMAVFQSIEIPVKHHTPFLFSKNTFLPGTDSPPPQLG